MSTVLSIRHLTKQYGKKSVLNDMSFEVEDGEFFVVYGPSGVGKTTLLNLIAGLDTADSGEIWLDGRRIDYLSPDERDVSMTFQTYALYPQWTAFDNIASPLRAKRGQISKEEVDQRVHEVARTLTIDHVLDHKPSELSGGQKQRVGLARSIVRPCRVLLLDSPLAHVDAKVRHDMRGKLKALGQTLQCAIVYVTHDYLEALGLGDRIAVVRDGSILQIATPHELYQQPVDLWTARSVGQPEINVLAARIDGPDIVLGETHTLPQPDVVLPLLSTGDRKHESDYLIGIRPEHFEIVEGEQGGELRGHVQLCQWVGTRTIVTIVVEGLPNLIIAAWGLLDIPPGTSVGVNIQWENVLWFATNTGQNILTAEEYSNDASSAIASK